MRARATTPSTDARLVRQPALVMCGEEGIVPLLQMHDELDFSLHDPRVGERVSEIMRTAYRCSVPFLVDAEWGGTWGSAKYDHATAAAALRAGKARSMVRPAKAASTKAPRRAKGAG